VSWRFPDWVALFRPDAPVLEIVVRGSVTYLGLVALLRLTPNRESGTLATGNLLLIVLLADAAQNAMAGEYRSISDGLILVMTLVLWSLLLDWASYRFRWLERLTQSAAVRLIRDGRILRPALRRELISEEELTTQLRRQGIEDIREVKHAWLEPDGQVSVIKWRRGAQGRGGAIPREAPIGGREPASRGAARDAPERSAEDRDGG
jgi:uncharacterized membrane protein YcaP (DUF421 family)